MVKIYIAGRYSRRDEFRRVRDKLVKLGHKVTSRWLDENEPLTSHMGEQTTEWYKRTQRIDLEDINSAHRMLFFAEDPLVGTPRGGRHVEFGYALGMGMVIDVIGQRENVFHYNQHVYHYDSLEDYLASF